MKVCVVGLRGFPNVMGGIERHCEQLYPRMRRRSDNLDITVIARRPYVKNKRKYKFADIKVVPLPSPKSKYIETILHSFISVIFAKIFVKADLLHIHAIGPGLFSGVGRILGMKVIVTHHGPDYRRNKWNKIAAYFLRYCEKNVFKFSNRIIVVGRSYNNELSKHMPLIKKKFVYIPNGATCLTENAFRGTEENKLLKELSITKRQYVMTVGRLVPEKGFHDLIDAFERTDSEMKLVIVGGADFEDAYAKTILQRASDRIVFAGVHGNRSLGTLYANAAMFVLPSYHEGLPLVALEALIAGMPLVLSDIVPNRDIGLPDCCYFRVGDVGALEAKLRETDYSLFRPRDAQLQAEYDWDLVAEKTLALYREVMSEP